jgi:hypothetical protein
MQKSQPPESRRCAIQETFSQVVHNKKSAFASLRVPSFSIVIFSLGLADPRGKRATIAFVNNREITGQCLGSISLSH